MRALFVRPTAHLQWLAVVLSLLLVPSFAFADRDPSAADPNAPSHSEPVVPAFLPAPATLPSSAWLPLARQGADAQVKTVTPRPYEVVGSVRHLAETVALVGKRTAFSAGVTPAARAISRSVNAISLGINSEGVHGLRLHLRLSDVPEGTRAWVQSDDNAAGPFELPSSGELWTPLVFGSRAVIHVIGSASQSASIEIDRIAELTTDLRQPEPQLGACILDIMCSTPKSELADIVKASTATAMIGFVSGNDFAVCTGGLINVASTSAYEPYILTAHHCISSSSEAASAEFFFDYYTSTCGGAKPDLARVPRVSRASLLTTGKYADFTLLEMSAKPAAGTNGRWFFGWDSTYYAESSLLNLYRVSHPAGNPQKYSRHAVAATGSTCNDAPRGGYIYSSTQTGGVEGGSSGAPAFINNGGYYIVGQLFGQCGASAEDGCNRTNSAVDGALNVSYEALKPWLRPSATTCTANSTTLCLQNNRFEVKLAARDPRSGKTDSSQVMSSTNFFGYFAFPVLTGNTTDPQVFIKILDGTPVNGKWWVFYASLTDVEFTLTVRDSKTGAVKTYRQDPYTQKSANDTNAF